MDHFLHKLNLNFRNNSNATAIVSEELTLTYGELDKRSNALANALLEKGAVAGQIIGIFVHSRSDAITSIIATLQIGCIYLPLDPVYPMSRLEYMVKKSNAKLIITDNKELDHISTSKLRLGEVNLKQTPPSPFDPMSDSHSSEVGYVIFTSGSTGDPKGVLMLEGALNNLIDWQNKQYAPGIQLRTAQFSSLSFDVSFQEIFSTLCMGGTLYLIEDHIKQDFRALLAFIDTHAIERIFMPYIAVLHLVQWACRLKQFPTSLIQLITAGEQLIIGDDIRHFFTRCSNASLLNQYGPSESHVVTEFALKNNPKDWPSIPPIGKAIDNATILILDENKKPVSNGGLGEIYIGGCVLASGYINNEQGTNERFIEVAINDQLQRVYKTGDMGASDSEGNVHYKDRVDNQVKISGYRVELGEIEAILLTHEKISDAAVGVIENAPGQRSLVGFIVCKTPLLDAEIDSWVCQQLPAHMVPKKIVHVDHLDRTASGKVDRKTLIEKHVRSPKEKTNQKNAPSKLATHDKEKILAVISEELGGTQCTAADNLNDLGMDSLAANRIAARFYDELKLDIPAYQFFQHKNIQSLIRKITGPTTTNLYAIPYDKKTTDTGHDIAIIGMSLSVPGADDLEAFWENLVGGVESIHYFDDTKTPQSSTPQSNTSPNNPPNNPESSSGTLQNSSKVNARGLMPHPLDFDAGFFNITPKEAEFIDPQQRAMLEQAWLALEDAGCIPDSFSGRIGVYCGVGNNTYYLNNVLKNQEKLENFGSLQAMIANEKDYTATRISHGLNLKGPSVNILTACSTSLVSICSAVDALRTGACDVALAGGASITFPQQQPYEYQDGGIFSKDGHTRTFDQASSGTVFSDGAGMVVLKRLDYAKNDQDKIYAIIKGAAVNNDGGDKSSFSAPSIEGQKNVIVSALLDAKISADQVSYVEAHGTATPLGDPIEVEALKEAFQTTTMQKRFCGLGSIKSNLGHLTPAAGVTGLIKTALAIHNNFIPPTINFSSPNSALKLEDSPFYIADTGKQWNKENGTRMGGVSSFGIGGTNAHVILANEEKTASTTYGNISINNTAIQSPICVSAKSESALLDYLTRYESYFSNNPNTSIADIAYTSQTSRESFRYRDTIVASSVQEACKKAARKIKNGRQGKPFKTRNLVYLFPGQGTQTLGMGSFLYKHNNTFKKHVDHCADLLLSIHKIDIKEVTFTNQKALEETANAQPAIFTLSYALVKTLEDAGISPNATIGHSIGELVSAVTANVFDLKAALEVVVTRGQIMQAQPSGSMLAVMASAETLANYTTKDVVLAADNTLETCTLSGPNASLDVIAKKLQTADIGYKKLHTSHAFHSPLMAGAEQTFIDAMGHIQMKPPEIPFISCITGDWITDAQATDIRYWAQQIVSPVQFRKGTLAIGNLENALLIEIGARQVLSALCLQNLVDKEDIRYSHIMAKPGVESEEMLGLASVFGDLWKYGYNLDWKIINGSNGNKVTIPNYPFQRKTYYIDEEYSPPLARPLPSTRSLPHIALQVPRHTAESEPQRNTNMKDTLIEKLKYLFSESSGLELDDIDVDANFFELGLNSLFLTQASLQLKKELKANVTFRQLLNECNSFSKLAAFLINAGITVESQNVDIAHNDISNSINAQSIAPPDLASMSLDTNTAGLTDLFSKQMQLINNQMTLLSQALSNPNTQSTPTIPSPPQQTSPQQSLSQHTIDQENNTVPFGASVRINVKRSNEISATQQIDLDNLVSRYNQKLNKSKAFAQENRNHLADPRVVSGFRSTLKEIIYPVVVERSKGAYLWDIDGNRYIDITCGFGSNMFGNGADFIRNAIANQLETGYEIGPQNPLVADVSKMFCELTKSDRMAFCNTGSEAVVGAVRLARTVTAKEKVVMFENDYHGINDEVIVSRGRQGKSIPASAGIPNEAVSNAIILEYGDEKSLDYIKDNADDIAAVLIEPIQSRNPELQPKEFLQKLRGICTEGEIAFIFDEVITGLRIHPNGAQGYYGIQSDIATYGKIIGGGMPIGVIAGKKEFMDALDGGHWQFGDDSAPEVGVTYFAGTFVRHPLALAAAKAILLHLKENPNIQSDLNAKAKAMVTEINDYCKSVGAPIKLPNCGSLFKVKIPQDIPYEELIYVLLREKGIHIWDARPCFITTAHSDEDITFFINAFKQSVDEMQAMGFLPKNNAPEPTATLDTDSPPIPGARLGKKPNGEPAWFIKDPDRPGKYKIIADE